jgi:hypothetical protein
MASEYRDLPDFPGHGLPLRSWPDLARVMLRNIAFAGCDHELVSLITSTLSLNSLITDELNLNSLIC